LEAFDAAPTPSGTFPAAADVLGRMIAVSADESWVSGTGSWDSIKALLV